MKLVYNVLYPLALGSYAGTNGIHLGVHGINGNFRAGACFTDHALDFHSAAVNFRNLQFKKPLQKSRMGSGRMISGPLVVFLTSST